MPEQVGHDVGLGQGFFMIKFAFAKKVSLSLSMLSRWWWELEVERVREAVLTSEYPKLKAVRL